MRKMKSGEIRQMWLDFFASKGHHIEEGSSLIPHNDPTLLWINSGVAALKKYFDGSLIPASKRITNAQRSIRTNDIENVGKTDRHHTFFEMLGNFSIGDYFRNEVIPWAVELLTSDKYFGFPKEKLYMTYFPQDLATKKLWMDNGIEESHLIPLEGNFWEIGEGPCGPDTEIFFDRGTKYDPEDIGVKLLKEDISNDRYIEIWNIVFSQFNAQSGVSRDQYKELPSKNIDTGCGLERLACIMQETESNFETDLFWPLIEQVKEMSGKEYKDNKMAYRVIADHIRACTFAISDGEMFSNEGRGYVLRRLLRRAERFGKVLGINKPFLFELVPTVAKIMESYYPYLQGKTEFVSNMIKAEEIKFLNTLNNGESLLKDIIAKEGYLSGENMFKLYDTFGFPKELTIEICEENNIKYDLDKFNLEMKAQKERARAARSEAESMAKQSPELMAFTTKSEFTYGSKEISSKVIGCFINGNKVDKITNEGDIILEKTIFYAESGGQVADSGEILGDNLSLKVTAVNKAPNKQHLHHVISQFGEVKVGDIVNLKIDEEKRKLITRNHSSVHLLQKALTDVLGDHIAQHGSFVSDEYSHFDFAHFAKVTPEQLSEVEMKVNKWISEAIDCETKVLPIEEAKKLGARALFNDKYGDTVRVVCFGDVSKEFCGGTHVTNTSDIGVFVIESEESVASGVRRITARTSLGAYKLMKQREYMLNNAKNLVKASSYSEVNDRAKALINELDNVKVINNSLSNQLADLTSASLVNNFKDINGIKVLSSYLRSTNKDGLLSLIDKLKGKYPDYAICLMGEGNESFPIVIALGGKAKDFMAGKLIREVANIVNGNGGGRPDMAQGSGKDKSMISEALNKFESLLK